LKKTIIDNFTTTETFEKILQMDALQRDSWRPASSIEAG